MMVTTAAQGRRLNPPVSVVTVVKDPQESQWKATVDSVARQTLGPIEYVVVDGGGTPTGESAARYCGSAVAQFVLVAEPDRGIYDAMNKAVERARGDFLLFLNAADTLVPHALQHLVDCAVQGPDGAIVYCDYWFGEGEANAPERVNDAFDFYNMGVAHQALIVPRRLFSRLGPYRTDFSIVSDHLWLREARDAGVAFVHLAERLVRIDDAGLSSGAMPGSLARFECEAARRVTLRFPFVPEQIARAVFRFRRDVTVWPCIDTWTAQACGDVNVSGHPLWQRFKTGLADYFNDVMARCHGVVGGPPRYGRR